MLSSKTSINIFRRTSSLCLKYPTYSRPFLNSKLTAYKSFLHRENSSWTNNSILENLDEHQRFAVTAPNDSVLQILAGPGSGKTTVLVRRIAWLIANEHVNPKKIVVLTFSHAAAIKLKTELGTLLGSKSRVYNDGVIRNTLDPGIICGTFDSIGLHYLSKYSYRSGLRPNTILVDDKMKQNILHQILKSNLVLFEANKLSYEWNKSANAFLRTGPSKVDRVDTFTVSKLSDWVIANCFSVENFAAQSKAQENPLALFVLKLYQNYKKENNLLDYNDTVSNFQRFLWFNKDIVQDLEHIFVDEYQDTDLLQYRIIKQLALAKNHFTIVGDRDQSIYKFRYAQVKNFNRMRKDYPETLRHKLPSNYKSTKDIVTYASDIINLSKDRSGFETATEAVYPGENTIGVSVTQFDNELQEAKSVADQIDHLVSSFDGAVNLSDIAILVRARKTLSNIQVALERKGIPYYAHDSTPFWESKAATIYVDFFKAISSNKEDQAFERIIDYLDTEISPSTIAKIKNDPNIEGSNIFEKFENIVTKMHYACLIAYDLPGWKTIEGLISIINKCRGYLETHDSPLVMEVLFIFITDFLTKSASIDMSFDKLNQLGEFPRPTHEEIKAQKYSKGEIGENPNRAYINACSNIHLLRSLTETFGNRCKELGLTVTNGGIGYLNAFLDDTVGRFESLKNMPSDNRVSMSTIHSSKGLEWPIVFLPFLDQAKIFQEEGVEESRRLLYVATTRSKCACYLSYSSDSEFVPGQAPETSKSCSYVELLPKTPSDKNLKVNYLHFPKVHESQIDPTISFLKK